MRVRSLAAASMILGALSCRPAGAGPALLFDPSDGKVLYAEDPDNQWHPASLTKIMTAYLAFEAIKEGKLKLDQKIACSQNAFQQAPSKLGLPIGGELTVELALKALIIKSANDVAVMLAEAVAGSDTAFVGQMNATARRLGMTRTTFVNPNGLPAHEQVTTARDLARLAQAVVKDFPEHAGYWAMADMRLGKLRLGTHNGLLKSFQGADGMKTGFICDSGFNVVASATRDGHKLMAVVLGEPTGADRTVRAASLLEHGFQHYGWKTLFSTASIDNIPIAPDAKGLTTMRQSVVSWECGTGRRSRSAAARQGRTKAAKAKGKPILAATNDADAATATKAAAAKPAEDRPAAAAAGKDAGASATPSGKKAKGAPKPIQASAGGELPSLTKPKQKSPTGGDGAAAVAPPDQSKSQQTE
ncbi:MAG TPA: D-alanyl-D-alanine carboxypeptidase family protein [Hyphomicrobiaceae bacterium]|nr:D-alanyl-D-alanine carboxypeptidase family protein [Hyphomicrobiaceae bacterium]